MTLYSDNIFGANKTRGQTPMLQEPKDVGNSVAEGLNQLGILKLFGFL
jgi:hypothetical protein